MPENVPKKSSGATSANQEKQSQKIPVVGIGASAGGLEAFKAFFGKMPADTGLAFVLVPHLDPGHKSLMVEIIARHTDMPVVQVQDRMQIKPNHIYIVSPNRNLRIEGGDLVPSKIVRDCGINLPVDIFFRSMALVQKERAIGIILSGTMRDGTMGLKAIKEYGGIVIAQSPETAQHDGMPQSAIDTGMVDFVLPIEKMPQTIVRFITHPYIHEETKPPDKFQLDQVLSVIQSRFKHDFRQYKRNTLVRRTERRMGLRQIEEMGEYLTILKEDHDEAEALLKDYLIGVTGFFREPDVWEKVRAEVLPPMIKGTAQDAPLRIWVPACSTGEEAYTIALLFHDAFEKLNRHFNAQIFATDIDGEAITIARKGVYPEAIAANVPHEFLKKYFSFDDEAYRISRRIRESVVFAEQNLICDPPFSGLNIISCRNLLIYLNPDVQKKVIDLFHFSLLENGCLILGSSETIGFQNDLFETISKEERLYRRLGQRNDRAQIPILSYAERHHKGFSGARINYPRQSIPKLMQSRLLQRFAPAAVLIDSNYEIVNLHGPTSQYLNLPQGEPVMDLTAMVKDGLRLKLRSAIHKAIKQNKTIAVSDARVKRDQKFYPVSLEVSPVKEKGMPVPLYLVTFQECPTQEPEIDRSSESDMAEESIVKHLEAELTETREDLQNTIEELETSNEELKASNEEMMSMNEELQSSNEELETSKEELQSMNEELNTVNTELREKVRELERTNNDMVNLMNSTQVATLFLDVDLSIRRFTPAAKNLFNLIPSDVGRPIAHLSMRFSDDDLNQDVKEVLDTLIPRKKEVKTDEGTWYARNILPFRTQDNRVDGLVLTFNDVTNLKTKEDLILKSEQQLKEKSQLLSAVLDHTYMMAVYLDPQFNFIWVNQAYARTCGQAPGFFPGKNHFDLYPHAENQEIFQRVADTGEPFSVEAKAFEFPDQPERGTTYWDWSLVPTKDADGSVTGLVFTLIEITDRKRAELALEKERELFKAIVDRIPVMLTRYDDDTNMIFLNAEFERVVGWKTGEVQDIDMMEKVYPDPEYRQKANAYMQKTSSEWRSFRLQSKSGDFVDSEWSNIRLEDGTRVGIGIDITERLRVEKDLCESESQFRQFFENLTIGVAVFEAVDNGENFIFYDMNPAGQKLSKVSIDDIRGKTLTEIFPTVSSMGLDKALYETWRTGKPSHIPFEKYEDERITQWVENRIFRLPSGNVVAVYDDRTEMKKLEEKLLRAQRLESIGRLAGGIAHDFNNMLTIILGNAELLHEDVPANDSILSSLQEIQTAAEHSRDLTKQLLAFARKQPIAPKSCDLNLTIEDMLGMLERLIGEDLELIWRPKKELWPVKIDSSQIDQILTNLCVNARDAIDGIGKITIETDNVMFDEQTCRIHEECLPGEFVMVSVSDTGCGMAEEVIENLFDPFFTTKAFGQGTGLGLSTVYGIVKQNNGFIDVSSKLKSGTTFKLYFPKKAIESKQENATPDEQAATGGTETILLVEDEEAILQMAKKMLERLGYTVMAASGPLEAVRIAESYSDDIQLLMTDVIMPEMNGKDLAEKLLGRYPNMKCLFMSGYTDDVIADHGILAEKTAFINKPFSSTELARTVSQIFSRTALG
ncbi:chemotaxis protein CheB [uncultured Desulfobacter sp.]|uniref:chemotaxis protein CheB n=1 Tax=uncultured Desulfobacter sp. TaxID=240139 RepID=UPI0029F4EC74|nr:chemotaxis protein CheB [uncultured Desulfobacter sp.]